MDTQEHFTVYQICVKGHLDERWLRWLDGMTISQESNGETVISGEMDQASLHGVLNRIRDLGLELISVQRTITENTMDQRTSS
jgi:hypothetical protein